MTITKINQEKMLENIAKTVSKIERENYKLVRLNIPNNSYKIYGKPNYKGNLFIIGNIKYLNQIKYRYKRNQNKYLKRNFRFKLNRFKKLNDKKAKGIVIVFNDNPTNEPYKFKRIIGINKNNYAYLDSIADILNNQINEDSKKDIYFSSLDYIYTNNHKTNKKLIKTLNGKTY